ncbi:molybdate ABC transporter substrate-binding protein [Candidatus Electronema sp. PJ]|uniref:molybdate ABC transporter substrate-binding protein n=1 Tax=Candidatus Electronema sp. PJ TaxID=3401572 RepID=UPI003AA87C25
MNWKIILSAALLPLWLATALQAETVHLSAAASLTEAVKEIIASYTKEPQAEARQVLPNFGGSGALAKQIEQGAPADIFISASPEWTTYLTEKQLAAQGTATIFAGNKLVFVGAPKAAAVSLEKLADLQRIAIGNPKSVPAGQYAMQAMERASVYSALAQDKKLVLTDDVRQALMYADQGEVDGAFVYMTDALLAKNVKVLFTVADSLHDEIQYPMLMTKAGEKNAAAKEFYAYLTGAKAKAILEKHGFEVKN